MPWGKYLGNTITKILVSFFFFFNYYYYFCIWTTHYFFSLFSHRIISLSFSYFFSKYWQYYYWNWHLFSFFKYIRIVTISQINFIFYNIQLKKKTINSHIEPNKVLVFTLSSFFFLFSFLTFPDSPSKNGHQMRTPMFLLFFIFIGQKKKKS